MGFKKVKIMPNSRLRLIFLIVAGVALLAGAAYLAMLYVFPGSNIARSLGLPGANGKTGIRIEQLRAPELPATDPNAEGSITAVQDNSLFITQTAEGDQGGGQSIEVVVSHATHLYRDATMDNTSKADIIRSGSRTVDMIVQPMKIADVAAGDDLVAWGELRGTRLIATDVLVMKNIVPASK